MAAIVSTAGRNAPLLTATGLGGAVVSNGDDFGRTDIARGGAAVSAETSSAPSGPGEDARSMIWQ